MEFAVVALLIVAAVSLIWAQWLRPRGGKTKRQTMQAKGYQAAAKSTYQPTFDTPRGDGGGPTASPSVTFTGTIPGGSEAAERLARDMSALVNEQAHGQLNVSQTFEEVTTTPLWSATTRTGGPAGTADSGHVGTTQSDGSAVPVGATYTERSTTLSAELTERVSALAAAGKRDEAVELLDKEIGVDRKIADQVLEFIVGKSN